MKFLLAFLVLAFSLFLFGCRNTSPANPIISPSPSRSPQSATISPGAELIALAESEEEAREIAEQYGVELVGFSSGVAVFHTEEDPNSVIEKGRQNGWPELALNHTVQGFSN